MARALVLTVIGEDRPGLVEALAELIERHEGSWDESRMARLAGHFAGVVQIHLPEGRAEGLVEALPSLAARGLEATVVDSDWSLAAVDHRDSYRLELVGQDRPGIVREISAALASLGVSVQDLRTIVESAPMSGERLFRAEAELAPPADLGRDEIRAALERLADDMMVDIVLDTGPE
ncbi:MAG: glycine cleavage system protein R [Deltaproteobacteria bacterium]|jgi:glycine cleavage system regulatory protein|nr:glycine cleavage system protein R [Deltaproteobacteria bacterium]MBW2498086.1 glycine cleavage system protein R [Deltaproteobacteria bacterium]